MTRLEANPPSLVDVRPRLNWVVPIMTQRMAVVAVADVVRTDRMAATMAPLMSEVVGVLHLATTQGPSIKTASVFVPPTSTPIRIAIPLARDSHGRCCRCAHVVN